MTSPGFGVRIPAVRPRTPWRAVAGALLMSLALSGQALGATWSSPKTLATSDASFLDGLVALSNGTALVVYVECAPPDSCYAVKVRRSTDGGATWEQPTTIAPDRSYFASISGRGSSVDVTYEHAGQIMYVRSRDSGETFGRHKRLAFTDGGDTSVDRGPGGVVAVSWTNSFSTGAIKARVSLDGGASFGPRNVVTPNSDTVGQRTAVGDNVAYVIYPLGGDLYVNRTLNNGTSWGEPSLITDGLSGAAYKEFDIAASGDNAYIIYASTNGSIRMRRSPNKGETWSPETVVNPRDRFGSGPRVDVSGGLIRAAYNASDGLYYRQSVDGATWSGPERISEIGYWPELGFTDHVVVAYDVWVNDDRHDVRARTRAE